MVKIALFLLKKVTSYAEKLYNWQYFSIIAGLAFSREGSVLSSSAIGRYWILKEKIEIWTLSDCTIAIWDFGKLMNEAALEEVNVTHNPDVRRDSENFLLGNYLAKNTPVLHLHFTRRNLLLASGPFEGWAISNREVNETCHVSTSCYHTCSQETWLCILLSTCYQWDLYPFLLLPVLSHLRINICEYISRVLNWKWFQGEMSR